MSSRKYWREREEAALQSYIKNEAEYDKEVKKIYQNQLNAIQTEINAFYGKYAKAEGITIAEAKKRVSQHDVKAFESKAAKYVKDRDFSAKANEELRLYNATMKINRLEMLKANIGLELISGHDELEKYMAGILKGRTDEELKRQAGILGKTILNNAKLVDSVVNASFKNATFSDRIWMHQDLLKNKLSSLLQSGMIQGKNPRVLARELQNAFNTSTYDAERLMRTELARVQTEAQKQSFKRNGFTLYEFIANSSCCDICQSKDGKHFRVDKMKPGFNAPPMHPNCRCSTAPWEDGEEYEAWLDYLDKGGTTEEWNASEKAIWKSKRRHEKKLENSGNSSTIDLKKYPNEIAGVKRGEKMTWEAADSGNVNPGYGKDWSYSINCQTCAPAFELRQRGYNIKAKGNTKGSMSEKLSRQTNLIWKDPATGKHPEYIADKSKTYSAKSYLQYLKGIIKAGERYTIEFGWKGRGNSGHIVNLDLTGDGKLRIKDNQRGANERSEWIGDTDVYQYLTRLKYSRTFYGTKVNTPPKVLRVDNMEIDVDVANQIFEERK